MWNIEEEIVILLLNKGANANTQCRERGTALQVALYKGNKKIVQLLLNRGTMSIWRVESMALPYRQRHTRGIRKLSSYFLTEALMSM